MLGGVLGWSKMTPSIIYQRMHRIVLGRSSWVELTYQASTTARSDTLGFWKLPATVSPGCQSMSSGGFSAIDINCQSSGFNYSPDRTRTNNGHAFTQIVSLWTSDARHYLYVRISLLWAMIEDYALFSVYDKLVVILKKRAVITGKTVDDLNQLSNWCRHWKKHFFPILRRLYLL